MEFHQATGGISGNTITTTNVPVAEATFDDFDNGDPVWNFHCSGDAEDSLQIA